MLHPYVTTIVVACFDHLSATFDCVLVETLWYKTPWRLDIVDKATGRAPKAFPCIPKWIQKQVIDAWAEYGIKVHPGAGKRCWDWWKGGFPVDYPKLTPLDRSIYHGWKIAKNGGLYSLWNARKRLRLTTCGVINYIESSWGSIPQSFYQNAIEGCWKVMKTCHYSRGNIRM